MATTEGSTSIDTGLRELKKLINQLTEKKPDWNEADTRFQFIDPFLINCLGWQKKDIILEQRLDNTFTDYELGSPRSIILEAKRDGAFFELPANPSQRSVGKLKSLILLDVKIASAIQQVQNYCSTRGTPIAIVCNGHQLIAFLASRQDGKPPLEGNCLIVNGYEQFINLFPVIWQNLSPSGILERRIVRFLTSGDVTGIPKKLSSYLLNYPSYRYKSEIQASLRTVAELLIEDVVKTPEVELQFYKECYCESGALTRDSLVSKQILAARYAALFPSNEESPKLSSVKPNKDEFSLTPEVMAEALSLRPIVLIGDVGVGKSSFLKHLMYISAFDEFKNAVYVLIDLGSQAALEQDLKEFVLGEIERQLLDRYEIDVNNSLFVRGVYNLEIERFRDSIYGGLYESDKNEYERKLLSFLEQKIQSKAEHLRKAINHIVNGRKRQVVLMIDNADQRNIEIQQDAFIVAQNFAQQWKATVFIAVRPQTFHFSKRAGTFAAYPQKVFTIAPPRSDQVIEKRLKFALEMAEGRLAVERLKGVEINFPSLSLFLKALLHSLSNNNDLVELISNISGGNIRQIIDLVIKFIGSSNVDAKKIIKIMKETGEYIVPVHEFSKSAILGDYSHYHSDSSIAINMFDVRYPDEREHFLIPIIIGYLNHDDRHRNREGFVSSEKILEEMQRCGFTPQQIESALRRTTNKKLIETTERITFDEDITGLIGDMPAAFRITTVGAYHLQKWTTNFAYLDAMVFDTPIFDSTVMEELIKNADSFNISDRAKRSSAFRTYLSKIWYNSELAPPYFDWSDLLPSGNESFGKVERFLSRQS